MDDPCRHSGHQEGMWLVEFESHAIHRHDRDLPTSQLIEGSEQFLGGVPPTGKTF